MASIYKRDKIWWVHYLVAGKSVARSLKTTNERVALEKKKHLEGLEMTGQLTRPSRIPLASFLQAFCEYLLSTRTRKSAKNDISYLRTFFGPCCAAMHFGSHVPRKFRKVNQELPQIADKLKDRHIPVRTLEQISSEVINNFINDRRINDGISAKTANRMREVLYRMFSYAIESYGYICPDRRYQHPVQGVKRAVENAPIITWLTLEDIQEQLKVLGDMDALKVMVAVYIYAGLRREETTWLTRTDVDLKERLLRIRSKTMEGEFWQPKTKRNRVVPISDALFEILKVYTPPVDGMWFFTSPMGMRWDPDNFSKRLRKINRENGLNWSCLDYRHTFGSHLAQKGESLYKIAELMGNSPEICRRHYAALIPEKMRDTVDFEKPATTKMPEPTTDMELKEMLQKVMTSLGIDEPVRPRLRLVSDERA
jgi:integrase